MSFDETKAKRKRFVELFKKHRELVISTALDVFKDDDGNVPVSVISHLLQNQQAPAQLWDTATDDEQRQKFFDSLIASLSLKQSQLYEEIASLDALSTELSQIPDEEDEGDEDDDDDNDNNDNNDNEVTTLYHATSRVNIASIETTGLLAMHRQHVFFWEDENEAINVAVRHGDPDIAVIKVDKNELENSGYEVVQKNFGYGPQWCVRGNVPAQYLVFP